MLGDLIATLFFSLLIGFFFFVLAVELESRLFKVCDFLNNKAWDAFFSIPTKLYNATLGKLFSWISKQLSKTAVSRLDKTLADKGFGGIRPLCWVVASLIYVTVQLILTPSAIQDLLMNILTGTAIGAPIAFLVGGISFSLPTIIGAGFTRFLSTEALRHYNEDDDPKPGQYPQHAPVREPRREMHLLVKCLYAMIFLGAFGLLGNAMSGVFEGISNTLDFLANKFLSLQLFSGTAIFWDWFYAIVGGIGIIVVAYLCLLLLFMAFKEFLSNICYCLLPIAVLTFALTVISAFGLDKLDWLAAILVIVALLVGEWHRYQMENDMQKREKYLRDTDKFKLITHHLWPWILRRATRPARPCSPCSFWRCF